MRICPAPWSSQNSFVLTEQDEEVENVRFSDKMFGATSSEREKAAAAISRLKLRWDVKKQDYTGATIKCEEGRVLVAVFEGGRTTDQSPEYKP